VDADNCPKDKNFRLRPNRDIGLSVALTPDQAMAQVRCKGYTWVTVGEVMEISRSSGRDLRIVRDDNDPSPEHLEIRGFPLDDETAQQAYALAFMNKAKGRFVPRSRPPATKS